MTAIESPTTGHDLLLRLDVPADPPEETAAEAPCRASSRLTEASLHSECRCRLDCLGVCLRVGSAIADGRPQELRVTLVVIIACATAAADVDVGLRAHGDSCGTFVWMDMASANG